jgi:protoporphyrinogen oxidase
MVLPYFERIGFFKRKEVRTVYLLKQSHAYPVYDMTYTGHLKKIKDYLDRFENLIYIGRPGRFKYTNQDHSLEMGIAAAKSIEDGQKYDIEKIGSENEYFEKGRIYQKRI